MTKCTYQDVLKQFEDVVRGKEKARTMAALIIDSPWMPGYAEIDTIDFYFDSQVWLDTYLRVRDKLAGVAFVPDMWVEFGMAAEPSGWGLQVRWNHDSPPSLRKHPGGISALLDLGVPDPESDGLMPIALRQYERIKDDLGARGLAPRMVAARGPLAVASHLIGVTEFLMATQLEPENCIRLLENTTELCIRWLRCQSQRIENPLAIFVLDDVVGMMGPDDAEMFAFPFLRRIFEEFPDSVHIFHNDTPNDSVYSGLSTVGIDVFNWSHEVDISRARSLLGSEIVLMGNIPPVDVLVRGSTEQARKETEQMVEKAREFGPLLISAGGGVSPGTPMENLKALVDVVRFA
ncbi:MAG: uroporphyrinogen decarboxylase family protein [bacterium]